MHVQAIGCQRAALLVLGLGLAIQFDWLSYLVQAWQRATAEQTLGGAPFWDMRCSWWCPAYMENSMRCKRKLAN